MSRFQGEVLDWLAASRVAPGREREALRIAEVTPSAVEWRNFLAHLTLWLGTLALAAAVIFFFAFNWDDLGRFAKFGLVEGAILVALLVCWRVGLDTTPGQAVLMLLSLLTGALLALAGQIYQTGADTYELFGWWAVLILPWVVVSRFSPLWLVWLALLNLTGFFYFARGSDSLPWFWTLFALNGGALVALEIARRRGVTWLSDDWPPRLVAIAAGAGATALIFWTILETNGGGATRPLAVLAYAGWLAALYYWYRHARPDLFMLAGGVLSLIIAVATFLTRHLLETGSGAFLLIALVVIGMSAGGALWLKSIAQEPTA